ncbi:SCAN domain-containing protein 3-like protein [Lates japonicus]|uniref:SCAN domain-containing protein 3-like protein n=1 Tax=Lates japonicus TaxID=270547 RepID=A0AAD3R7Y3_LATJO|nr:SCAN domain-containing protein 3-like protein [Lates japonicus]
MFPQPTEFLHTNNLSVATMREFATLHLRSLSKHFSSYFSDVNTDAWDWVRHPFAPAARANGLTGKAEEQLLELSCDTEGPEDPDSGTETLQRGKYPDSPVNCMREEESRELIPTEPKERHN